MPEVKRYAIEFSDEDGHEREGGIYVLASDYDALEKKLKGIEKRLPPCGPCDIGENTECTCKDRLVPQSCLDAVIKERDAALSASCGMEKVPTTDIWKSAYEAKQLEFQAETLRASGLAQVVQQVAQKNCTHAIHNLGGGKNCLEAKALHKDWGKICLPCQAREILAKPLALIPSSPDSGQGGGK